MATTNIALVAILFDLAACLRSRLHFRGRRAVRAVDITLSLRLAAVEEAGIIIARRLTLGQAVELHQAIADTPASANRVEATISAYLDFLLAP